MRKIFRTSRALTTRETLSGLACKEATTGLRAGFFATFAAHTTGVFLRTRLLPALGEPQPVSLQAGRSSSTCSRWADHESFGAFLRSQKPHGGQHARNLGSRIPSLGPIGSNVQRVCSSRFHDQHCADWRRVDWFAAALRGRTPKANAPETQGHQGLPRRSKWEWLLAT